MSILAYFALFMINLFSILIFSLRNFSKFQLSARIEIISLPDFLKTIGLEFSNYLLLSALSFPKIKAFVACGNFSFEKALGSRTV
jgi:hypothetical protein